MSLGARPAALWQELQVLGTVARRLWDVHIELYNGFLWLQLPLPLLKLLLELLLKLLYANVTCKHAVEHSCIRTVTLEF